VKGERKKNVQTIVRIKTSLKCVELDPGSIYVAEHLKPEIHRVILLAITLSAAEMQPSSGHCHRSLAT
jgi:hypothetical protein